MKSELMPCKRPSSCSYIRLNKKMRDRAQMAPCGRTGEYEYTENKQKRPGHRPTLTDTKQPRTPVKAREPPPTTQDTSVYRLVTGLEQVKSDTFNATIRPKKCRRHHRTRHKADPTMTPPPKQRSCVTELCHVRRTAAPRVGFKFQSKLQNALSARPYHNGCRR